MNTILIYLLKISIGIQKLDKLILTMIHLMNFNHFFFYFNIFNVLLIYHNFWFIPLKYEKLLNIISLYFESTTKNNYYFYHLNN